MSFWRFFRTVAGIESGRWCRGCGEGIERTDAFGRSEGVCRPCRGAG